MYRERQKADIGAAPARMLNGCALVAAGCAPRPLPQHIARRVAAPADDGDRARQRCVMLAVLAVQPQPRRGAVQVDDTRSIQDYLGHKDIRHTVRYTELSPKPFRDFWRD